MLVPEPEAEEMALFVPEVAVAVEEVTERVRVEPVSEAEEEEEVTVLEPEEARNKVLVTATTPTRKLYSLVSTVGLAVERLKLVVGAPSVADPNFVAPVFELSRTK